MAFFKIGKKLFHHLFLLYAVLLDFGELFLQLISFTGDLIKPIF
jgi:hypothetical protein